jgi:hypothetical protein
MGISATIAVVGAIGSGISYVGQRKTARAQKKQAQESTAVRRRAEALQTRKDNIVAARQRARSASEKRRAQGSAISLAVNRGVGGAGGSTIPGVLGSLQQQFASGAAFQNQIAGVNTGIRTAFSEARDIASQPITAGTGITAFGGLVTTAAGGLAGSTRAQTAIGKLFG